MDRIEIHPYGPGACEHNLVCWICQKASAVYDMYPNWCFRPCWSCQGRIYGKKKWWQFWRDEDDLKDKRWYEPRVGAFTFKP